MLVALQIFSYTFNNFQPQSSTCVQTFILKNFDTFLGHFFYIFVDTFWDNFIVTCPIKWRENEKMENKWRANEKMERKL